MSENEISVLDVLTKLVLPKLDKIEQAIKDEHNYNEATYVKKEVQEAIEKKEDKLWTRRGVMATIFGVGSGFMWAIMNHVWR